MLINKQTKKSIKISLKCIFIPCLFVKAKRILSWQENDEYFYVTINTKNDIHNDRFFSFAEHFFIKRILTKICS